MSDLRLNQEIQTTANDIKNATQTQQWDRVLHDIVDVFKQIMSADQGNPGQAMLDGAHVLGEVALKLQQQGVLPNCSIDEDEHHDSKHKHPES